jgi:hypothetical protein
VAKSRGAVDDNEAIGPAPGVGTIWAYTLKTNVPGAPRDLFSRGATAFEACANAGINLGMVESIFALGKEVTDG